jgi:hypothetical protein
MPMIYSEAEPQAIWNEGHLEGVEVEYSGSQAAILGLHDEGVNRVIAHAPNGYACAVADASLSNSVCSGAYALTSGVDGTGQFPATLRNVTAYGTAGGLLVMANKATVPVTVVNSILHSGGPLDVDAEQSNGGSATVTLDHSNYASAKGIGGATVTPAGSGINQTAAPLLVDAAAGDFREASGSPTIDAGVEDAANGDTDLAGSPRNASAVPACTEPQTGPPDIGAYEVVPTALPASQCTSPRSASTNVVSLRLRKVKLNKRKGTATLLLIASGPGTLVLTGKHLAKQGGNSQGVGVVKLAIKPKGKLKQRLAQGGSAKARVKVSFKSQGGGETAALSKVVTLRARPQ